MVVELWDDISSGSVSDANVLEAEIDEVELIEFGISVMVTVVPSLEFMEPILEVSSVDPVSEDEWRLVETPESVLGSVTMPSELGRGVVCCCSDGCVVSCDIFMDGLNHGMVIGESDTEEMNDDDFCCNVLKVEGPVGVVAVSIE